LKEGKLSSEMQKKIVDGEIIPEEVRNYFKKYQQQIFAFLVLIRSSSNCCYSDADKQK
jgi:hypothetical protein